MWGPTTARRVVRSGELDAKGVEVLDGVARRPPPSVPVRVPPFPLLLAGGGGGVQPLAQLPRAHAVVVDLYPIPIPGGQRYR
eukprot:228485-Prorocentrum_minimum.AAC.1